MIRTICFVLLTVLLTGGIQAARADLKSDIGYTQLADELAGALPTGIDVTVSQVETDPDGNYTILTYMPDGSLPQFSGKTITDKSENSMGSSSHATTVGTYYYGSTGSSAPGVTAVDAYVFHAPNPARTWLVYGYLLTGTNYQPMYNSRALPYTLAAPSRVVNHSWVGSVAGYDAEVLRRSDFTAETDDLIHVVAVNNGSSPKVLPSGMYNGVTVGRTDGDHPSGTIAADTVYTAGRTCPLIVAPLAKTSYTTPVVASATALLVQAGRDTDRGVDPGQTQTSDRSGRSILNAERSEVIKAALLAGAGRMTYNTGTTAQITDYRGQDGNCTENGLDTRFGAGQVNIYNSYHIIAAGEQNSAQDDSAGGGTIAPWGFDVDPAFGGLSASNATATYRFTAGGTHRRLYASLVWHMDIDGGTWNNFDDTAVLHDLDLTVYDTTVDGYDRIVSASAGRTENTENVWCLLVPGRSYRIDVTKGTGQSDFVRDYALAWRMGTPADSDGDGMDDEWEAEHGLTYTDAGDATTDADGDGATALSEYEHGTSPQQSDSDGDGTPDGIEITAGTDPLNPAEYPSSVTAATPIALAVAGATLLFIFAGRCLKKSKG